MHARMMHRLTTCHGPHDRLMCLQAAARQWSSHTVDINGCTSRVPLHLMVVHAVVQWLPSICRVCRPRTIAISTSLSACSACVVRGRSKRLSRALRAPERHPGHRRRGYGFSGSMYFRRWGIATGRSAAGFIRSLRSRQKVSLFRLSGAATRRYCSNAC